MATLPEEISNTMLPSQTQTRRSNLCSPPGGWRAPGPRSPSPSPLLSTSLSTPPLLLKGQEILSGECIHVKGRPWPRIATKKSAPGPRWPWPSPLLFTSLGTHSSDSIWNSKNHPSDSRDVVEVKCASGTERLDPRSCEREFRLPWQEGGPRNHLDDEVDSDQ